MSNFEPNKEHLRHVLIFLFNQKKKAAEAHRILVETYGIHILSADTCERWFKRFRSGNFDISDKERENRPKKFEDTELLALLNGDAIQTQEMLAEQLNVSRVAVSKRLKTMQKIKMVEKSNPHELNDR